MKCKICNSDARRLFDKTILNNYPAGYYQCVSCEFIQTDEPVWLAEAYSNAITSLDIGLIGRNVTLRQECAELIDACFPGASVFLDYAGGYGMFVRMMRDDGFDFYRQDIYCENLFAKHFDVSDHSRRRFDLVTAFEVFEHFADPLAGIREIFTYSDNLVFSTKLIPENPAELESWWYLAPETGQHIAFYSRKTLDHIAASFGKKYYFNGRNLHLFTSEVIEEERREFVFGNKRSRKSLFGLKSVPFDFRVQRQSLLDHDVRYIRSLLAKRKD